MALEELGIKIGEVYEALPDEAKEALFEKLDSIFETAKDKLLMTEAKEKIAAFTDDDLREFVPMVYQRRIYDVDYNILWDKGVRLLSYDIDDTILPAYADPQKDDHIPRTKELFDKLKAKGFKIAILSNNSDEGRAEKVTELVGADYYIARARKPDTANYRRVLEIYEEKYGEKLDKMQMAHFGNRMCKDVAGANRFGCVSVLVRDMKVTAMVGKVKKALLSSVGHEIRKVMKDRNIWHKHSYIPHSRDQYYQLGEKQRHSENFPW